MEEHIIALVALTSMEIVLGIDNIVFIALITSRLPAEQQPKARKLGLMLALVSRIALLCTLQWILGLKSPLLDLNNFGFNFSDEEVRVITTRDLIILAGGLFLIWKSVREIHEKVSGLEDEHTVGATASFAGVLFQIAILDIVFSLDSVITAVGMAEDLRVMITSVILAIVVMLIFAERISRFVEQNPTLKVLALSFLILIGVMLTADGLGQHISKGYIYFAMAFALVVEMINLRVRPTQTPKSPALESPSGPARKMD